MKTRFSFFITDKQKAALKMRAIREGRPASAILLELLEEYLSRFKKEK
jgi:hypothetical protein